MEKTGSQPDLEATTSSVCSVEKKSKSKQQELQWTQPLVPGKQHVEGLLFHVEVYHNFHLEISAYFAFDLKKISI